MSCRSITGRYRADKTQSMQQRQQPAAHPGIYASMIQHQSCIALGVFDKSFDQTSQNSHVTFSQQPSYRRCNYYQLLSTVVVCTLPTQCHFKKDLIVPYFEAKLNIMMPTKALILLLSTFVVNVAAETYTASGTEVKVTTTILDENNSTRKCITYATNPPEKYETACFSTILTDGGTFNGCIVQFDNTANKRCDSCGPCTDSEEKVGFTIDCDSIIPAKTNLTCTLLNDMNIQTLLTDDSTDTFKDMPFSFTITDNLVTDDEEMGNNVTKINRTTTSGGTTVAYDSFIIAIAFVLTVIVF